MDHLTMLYLPPLPPDAPGASFYQLTHIMARLRGPGGCPWDREQSHRTIKRHLLEEAYEAIEALDNDDPAALEEELGDVLLQVSLHSEIAYTESDFDIGDVVRGLTAKLVRRHPHVFGAAAAETAADVLVNWQTIKQGERTERGDEDPSVLDGVPTALPALARAQALSLRASNAGFDWRESAEVWDKLHEELLELEEAGDFDRLEELGDLLFVVVNYARFYTLEAEEALRLANLKFDRRYRALEREVVARGALVSDVSSEDLDAIWNDVKIAERQSK
ncbi:MAG: nucleoside triphosphate pyrophosphohydrolase [Chloroflexia bacterium]